MSTRVLVTNIPIHAYIDAYVEIPDGLDDDQQQSAIRDAVERGEFRPKDGSSADNYEIDQNALDDGWEFSLEIAS